MDDIVFIGDWIKERELGKGSFGTVVLWKHKKTDEKLAIKTCQWGDELSEKHRARWAKEVEMLQGCRNPNIVGTKDLPPEFIKGLERANPSGLPILCMEYCSGGDLRQVLNKPESCAGLKEQQIRQILSDLRCAMHFLHQNKITHRDLKPENIVMHILDSVQSNVAVQSQRKLVQTQNVPLPLVQNVLGHWLQANGLIPVCLIICWRRFELLAKPFPHSEHKYGVSFVWVRTWSLRLHIWEKPGK
ncbi:hypothetical protein HF086_005623 [Spodoptera exigua]|uniref:IkappaB kinase n=1 Tax=Spodoptera exigua TaxID=7107 RepID=A0A922SQQ7_SPOEX|nr:hypothetical protein HF086_005623 [Spodoptera exigua]